MPELPEVETTKRGLEKTIKGLVIKDVWTDLKTKDKRKIDTVSTPKFFEDFKKIIKNKKIISIERKAKNILINISSGYTILIHMKMTGHLLYGKYKYYKNENKWLPEETQNKKHNPLKDPFNRYVHVIFSLSNKNHLAFSDMRKFGKITLFETKTIHDSKHLKNLGPDPLSKDFNLQQFKEKLFKRKNGKIKTVLMDQTIVSGIGNIYSDEILWRTGVRPERKVSEINEEEFKKMWKATKETLTKGIKFGGDSMSDYRNIYGLPGKFQLHHEAYRRTGDFCRMKIYNKNSIKKIKNAQNCKGVIIRKVIGGRSTHFCPIHQK